MSCVKTGARIYFNNYGMAVVGDVYRVSDSYIFRWNTNSCDFSAKPVDCNYFIDDIEYSDNWWHRDDLGVTVVPHFYVEVLI